MVKLEKYKPWLTEKNFLFGLAISTFSLYLFRLWDPSQTYFDEKPFYIKAAKEILLGNPDINLEHPPLPKVLMAIGIKLFGDNFFGWRSFSVLLGTLGVLTTYFIAKRLTGSKKVAALSSLFLAFEMGWFISSRIATIEIFVASFLLFGILFVLRLYQDNKLWNLIPAGVFFGAATASKWAALFLVAWVYLFLFIFWKRTLLVKIGTFVSMSLIIAAVYLSSFVVYLTKHSLLELIKLHGWMYYYHTKYVPEVQKQVLEAHKDYQFYPFPAWTWFFDPSFPFFGKTFGREATKAILFFYNPVVLWGGLVGLGSLALELKRKVKPESIFILGVFLAEWLPWLASPRYTLNYYLLSTIPFFSIAFSIWLGKILKRNPTLVYVLAICVVLVFIAYYPLVSALKVPYLYSRIILGIVEFKGNTGN